MPCLPHDYVPTAKERKSSQDAVRAHEQDFINTTNYLCQLCKLLDDPELDIIDDVPGLREWWMKHQKWDKQKQR